MMLEELERRNYSDKTIRYYVRFVERFAHHFGTAPDKLGLEHVRSYQAYLLKQRRLSPRSVENHVAALLFRAHAWPPRVLPVSSLSQGAEEAAQHPEPGRGGAADPGQQQSFPAHASDGSLRHRYAPR